MENKWRKGEKGGRRRWWENREKKGKRSSRERAERRGKQLCYFHLCIRTEAGIIKASRVVINVLGTSKLSYFFYSFILNTIEDLKLPVQVEVSHNHTVSHNKVSHLALQYPQI